MTDLTAAEQLRHIIETNNWGDPALINTLARGVLAERDELAFEVADKHAAVESACRTVAEMHAAAVGEVRGPVRGVVEDVAHVREARQAAEESLKNALASLQNALRDGWRQEWQNQDRVLIKEILIDRVKPWADWARVTIDGYRLPWFPSKATVSDIEDTIATVTLTFEAGLVVQSNAAPLEESEAEVLAREETLIARMRDSHRPADG